jgi:hypothetical protein
MCRNACPLVQATAVLIQGFWLAQFWLGSVPGPACMQGCLCGGIDFIFVRGPAQPTKFLPRSPATAWIHRAGWWKCLAGCQCQSEIFPGTFSLCPQMCTFPPRSLLLLTAAIASAPQAPSSSSSPSSLLQLPLSPDSPVWCPSWSRRRFPYLIWFLKDEPRRRRVPWRQMPGFLEAWADLWPRL